MVKGINQAKDIRVGVAKTTDLVKEAQRRHQLSPIATLQLGKALTGVVLMASELKGEERLTIKFQGNGPLSPVVAEANAVGAARGYLANVSPEKLLEQGIQTVGDSIGTGLLTVEKVLYNEARPVSGTVEMLTGNVSDDLAFYLLQSEQIPSAVVLDVGVNEFGEISHAGGILVQALPGAQEEELHRLQERLKELPPISELLASGVYIDEIMKKVFAPDSVSEINRRLVDFFCTCSEESFLRAISLLDISEIEEMMQEDQQLVCHYCEEKYSISSASIKEIFLDKKVSMN